MPRKYLCLLIIFLAACKVPHCLEDKQAVDKFKQRFNLIKSAEETNAEIYADDYRDALIFLSNITGIITRAEYSSTLGYRDKSKYKEDMKSWEKWLNKNKCKLTQRYIDSAMAQVKK